MRIAFKEWAVVVDALGHGGQIIILRKGGIREQRSSFQMEHLQFVLFPTLFHQQRESVVSDAQARFDQISRTFPSKDRVRLEFFAEVVEWQRLDSLAAAEPLRGQHIWREEVIAERFGRGKEKSIFALAVRVLCLPTVIELLVQESYGGCKSWIELEQEITVAGACPVLSDEAFACKLNAFRAALGSRTRSNGTGNLAANRFPAQTG